MPGTNTTPATTKEQLYKTILPSLAVDTSILQDINLSGADLQYEDLGFLLRILTGSKYLKKLDVSNNNLQDDGACIFT
jgi:hypothetical protein